MRPLLRQRRCLSATLAVSAASSSSSRPPPLRPYGPSDSHVAAYVTAAYSGAAQSARGASLAPLLARLSGDLAALRRDGMDVGHTTCTAALHVLRRDAAAAAALFDSFAAAGVRPSEEAETALMKAAALSGDRETLEHAWDRVCGGAKAAAAAGLAGGGGGDDGDVYAAAAPTGARPLHAYMYGLLRCGAHAEAEALVGRMERLWAIPASVVTLTSFVTHARTPEELARWDRRVEEAAAAAGAGTGGDEGLLCARVFALCRLGLVGEAAATMGRHREAHATAPPLRAHQSLLAAAGDGTALVEAWRACVRDGVAHDAESLTILLAFCKKRARHAEDSYARLARRAFFSPTFAAAGGGAAAAAVPAVAQHSRSVSLAHYAQLFDVAARTADVDTAEHLRRVARERGVRVPNVTRRVLRAYTFASAQEDDGSLVPVFPPSDPDVDAFSP